MSFPGVSVCVEQYPETSCSSAGAYVVVVPPFEVAASAWVLYDSSNLGACSGTQTFEPVAQLTSGQFLQSTDIQTLVCTDVAASTFTFGVGGLTPPFSVTQLDTTQVLDAFAAGFVLVGMFWALGRAIGAILDIVRR